MNNKVTNNAKKTQAAVKKQVKESSDSNSNRPFGDIPFITTWKNKNKSNKKIAKDLAWYYAQRSEGLRSRERIDRIEENADLHNGRWRQLENIKPTFNFSLGDEYMNLDGPKLRHFPVIDRVSKSIVAENAMRPLNPIIIDYSEKALNERKENKVKLIKDYLRETEVKPARQQALQQMGVEDESQLNQEQLQQLEQLTEQMTPEHVIDALKNNNTHSELIWQKYIDYGMRRYDIKNKLDLGYENAIQHAEEYYRLHVDNVKGVHLEPLNVKYVEWGGSEHTRFVEDAEYATYRQMLSYTDVIKRYGNVLKRSEIDRLQELYGPHANGTSYRGTEPNPQIEKRLLNDIADNPELQKGIDPRTREGQRKIANLYSKTSSGRGHDMEGILEQYVTFRWTRKMKAITRIDPETSLERVEFEDEYYTFSPLNGDVKEENIVADEAWHAVILGEEIFAFIEPLPYQNKSIEDPFGAKLSIYGCVYNDLMGNSKNMSLIDNGKVWQYKYNAQVARLEEYEATNIGKVMVGSHKMRPEGFSWQDFYKSGRYLKFLPVNLDSEAVQGGDYEKLFRSIDMSNNIDIAAALRQLDAYEQRIITSMYYNPSKLGEPSPYLTSGNNVQNLQASDRQLYKYFDIHRQVVERVLNGFLNISRIAFKDSELKKSVLLDGFDRAYLEMSPEIWDNMEIGLYVVNDFFETQKVDFLKNNLLAFIQNNYGSMKDFIKLANAKSISEMQKIADEVERKSEERQAQAQQNELKAIEQETVSKKDLMDYKNSLEMMREQVVNEFRMAIKELDITKFAKQYDIDNDGVSDLITKTEKDNASKERIAKTKAEADMYKADKSYQAAIKKLRDKRSS